jgi:two-component system sensor histidine kinase/response regulator
LLGDREAAGAVAARRGRIGVLVAEDNPVNQVVAKRMVERCGFRAHVVGDGREALTALAIQRYDAVLMDCRMPNLDGYGCQR